MDNKKKQEVLEKAGEKLVEILQDNIIQQGLIKTGALVRSVNYKVTDANNPTLDITMKDYGVYQDSGVNGTQVKFPANPQSLYEPGQFKNRISGFRPRPFIVKSYNQLVDQYLDEALLEAGEEDINKNLTATFLNNGATIK